MKKMLIILCMTMVTMLLVGVIIIAGLRVQLKAELSEGDSMANYYEHEFETENLRDIEISYISEKIRLYPSDSSKIIIKEHLNSLGNNKPAIITQSNGRLSVKSGKNNNIFGLFNIPTGEEKIEIFLPSGYSKSLSLSTVSGSIQSDSSWAMERFKANSTSGSIKMRGIGAGELDLNTVSGSIQAGGLINGGNVNTTSGSVKLQFHETGGRLSISTVSGGVRLTIPEEEQFRFKGSSVSGRITTFFPVNGSKRNVTGSNGQGGNSERTAMAELTVSTVSGSITVEP